MSRIGKNPIVIPDGVSVTLEGDVVTVKGPKGELSHRMHRDVSMEEKDGKLEFTVARTTKVSDAMWGTTRAVIANLVKGVNEGISKQLEIHGVGYRAAVKGNDLELLVGYSHPVLVKAPEGIEFDVKKEVVTVSGIDACLVGQVASDIRKVRKPEPYKGKGIRYVGEHVRRKVGKVVGTA